MLGFKRDVIERKGEPYLKRWMFRCPLFSVRLHHFVGSDPDDHHDHPWSFVSLLIKGGYTEYIREQVETSAREGNLRKERGLNVSCDTGHRRWWYWTDRVVHRHEQMTWVYRHRSTRHRVQTFIEGAWTLVLTGPERRGGWGFWVTDRRRIDHENYPLPWPVTPPRG